ncbi:MAG: hypothetical protein C4538_02930 [Nitrospiraceae bacterium]|nr:MAG: hypothetical protein C4538_02930 [Nitrospiraceae bacterium]
MENITVKNSLLITLRIFFVLFSIIFLHDAFFKWDGYSFYMEGTYFLYNASLTFVLWSIVGTVFTLILCILIYIAHRVIPQSLISLRLEHITFYFTSIFLLLFIKWKFVSQISFSDITGLSRSNIVTICVFLLVGVVWFFNKHTGKIIKEVDNRIRPLVWLFVFIIILAIPFSVSNIMKGFSVSTYVQHGHTSADKERPNIIFISWDALTSLDMQAYGYNYSTTPFISEWSREAVTFNKVYSSSNWTVPTTMTMMTGQQPWTHKVWHEAMFDPVDDYEQSMPAVLLSNNYTTYAIVQNEQCNTDALGLSKAFMFKDRYHTLWSTTNGWMHHIYMIKFFIYEITNNQMVAVWISSHPVFWNLMNFLIDDSDENIAPAENVYDSFLEHLSHNKKQPFFAWLHTFPPHYDYLPPKPYMGKFGNADQFNTNRSQRNFLNLKYNKEQQPEIDILRKRYDEFILYSDQQFKKFLMNLSEIIDMSNTIIIFSSDHGESFSHGYQGHSGYYLHEPTVRIPLIIKIPQEKKGKIIDIPVAQVDIAPTILALAGIPVPEWMEGRSLVPVIEGSDFDTRPIFSMQFIKNSAIGNNLINKGVVAVWEDNYKLIYKLEENKSMLFNLQDDPYETRNLQNEKPEIAQQLRNLIKNKKHFQIPD